MIDYADQHLRQTTPDLDEWHTGPVDFDRLLEVAALAGVPVLRCHGGRLERHEPPQRDTSTPTPAPRDPRLAQGASGGGEISARLSPRSPEPTGRPRRKPETSGSAGTSPEPPDLERGVAASERSRRFVRRIVRTRRG